LITQLEEKETITRDCLSLLDLFDSKTRSLESENVALRETINQLQKTSMFSKVSNIGLSSSLPVNGQRTTPLLTSFVDISPTLAINHMDIAFPSEKVELQQMDSKLNQPDTPNSTEEEYENY